MSASSPSSVSFVKELIKEYQSIKDARRALNVIGLNAREDMDAIEEDALEKLNALKKEAIAIIAREEKKKEKKKSSSWVRSFGRKVIVDRAEEDEKKNGTNSNNYYNTGSEKIQTRGDEEEHEYNDDDVAGRQPFSLAYLEAYESSPSPSAAVVDDDEYEYEYNVTPSAARHEKRSSFDFGAEDDKKWPAVPPMTVPRVAFRRDEYYYDGREEEEEEGTSFTSGDEEFEFSRSASYEETRVTSSRQQQYQHGALVSGAEDGENSAEREDWWFNVSTPAAVSTPAPPATNKEEKKNHHLTPEQVLESFDLTENKEPPFNSSMKKPTVSPLYASPTYSYEKQFEDALRFIGAMDLRTFKEQLVESKIDAVITEASASALGNLTNGTPSRADAWRTRVDVACEMLESAGAEAASEALMAKARALAAEVLKRR